MNLEKFDEKLKVIDSEIDLFLAVYERCREKNISDKDAIIAIFREVATDMRGKGIAERRDLERFVTVRVRDGRVKTVDAKEDLKKLGFKFDSEKKLWYRKMKKKKWLEIKDRLRDLSVEVSE